MYFAEFRFPSTQCKRCILLFQLRPCASGTFSFISNLLLVHLLCIISCGEIFKYRYRVVHLHPIFSFFTEGLKVTSQVISPGLGSMSSSVKIWGKLQVRHMLYKLFSIEMYVTPFDFWTIANTTSHLWTVRYNSCLDQKSRASVRSDCVACQQNCLQFV